MVAAKRLVALVVALLASTLAGYSFAAPPGPDALPVHVLGVKAAEALDQAEALTSVLKKAVRDSEGWSLGDSNQPLEFIALQMKCNEPIDSACEARIADVVKADRYLWCVVDFEGADKHMVVGKLNFFVRGKGTHTHELRYSANLTDPNSDALIEVAKAAVDAVTGGAPQGGLEVSTGGVAGQIFIDDKPMGALSADGGSYQLSAGKHRIVVKAPGYADAESSVMVKPAATIEVTLSMVAQEQDAPVDWRLVGGISALVVGAGTGGVGLFAALKVNGYATDQRYEGFIKAVPEENDVCAAAQGVPDRAYNQSNTQDPTATPEDAQFVADACSDVPTYEILQAVMFPVAAVSAGVGIYLLGTSDTLGGNDGEASALTVEPMVGPNGGFMSVRYKF